MPSRLDTVLAASIGLELELETWLSSSVPDSHRAVTAVAAVAYAAPVAGRRGAPAISLLLCGLVAVVQSPLHGNLLEGMTGILLPPLLLSYSIGRRGRYWPEASSILGAWGLFVLGIWLSGHVPEPQKYGSSGEAWVSTAAVLTLPWLAAVAMSYRARRADEYRTLAERIEETREEYLLLVVQTQRNEISDELDRLLAHTIAAIGLQAAGARQLMRRADAVDAVDAVDTASVVSEVEEAIAAIEAAGRSALADLRRLVNWVRSESGGSESPPALQGASTGPT